jgi:hypothetical protein
MRRDARGAQPSAMRKIEIAHEEEEIRRRTEEDERAGAKERRRKAGRFRVSRPLTADFSLRLPNPHPHSRPQHTNNPPRHSTGATTSYGGGGRRPVKRTQTGGLPFRSAPRRRPSPAIL